MKFIAKTRLIRRLKWNDFRFTRGCEIGRMAYLISKFHTYKAEYL